MIMLRIERAEVWKWQAGQFFLLAFKLSSVKKKGKEIVRPENTVKRTKANIIWVFFNVISGEHYIDI